MPHDQDIDHLHLLTAFHQALQRPGDVIDALFGAEDETAGYVALRERFGWDENQAWEVANMQFRRVMKVHRDAIARDLDAAR